MYHRLRFMYTTQFGQSRVFQITRVARRSWLNRQCVANSNDFCMALITKRILPIICKVPVTLRTSVITTLTVLLSGTGNYQN